MARGTGQPDHDCAAAGLLADRHPLATRRRGAGSQRAAAPVFPEQADGMSTRQWDALRFVADAAQDNDSAGCTLADLARHLGQRDAVHRTRNTVAALVRRGLLAVDDEVDDLLCGMRPTSVALRAIDVADAAFARDEAIRAAG